MSSGHLHVPCALAVLLHSTQLQDQSQETGSYVLCFVDSLILRISYKWNQTTCGLLCLIFFLLFIAFPVFAYVVPCPHFAPFLLMSTVLSAAIPLFSQPLLR